MADAPDHDEDFHPAKRGDTPIWLGGMKYVREDVAEADKQLAVAAALREAVDVLRLRDSYIAPNEMDYYDRGWSRALKTAAPAILALIPDAGAALDRYVKERSDEALAAERERVADAVWEEYQDSIVNNWAFRKEHVQNAIAKAAAIRHGYAISAQGDKT